MPFYVYEDVFARMTVPNIPKEMNALFTEMKTEDSKLYSFSKRYPVILETTCHVECEKSLYPVEIAIILGAEERSACVIS